MRMTDDIRPSRISVSGLRLWSPIPTPTTAERIDQCTLLEMTQIIVVL